MRTSATITCGLGTAVLAAQLCLAIAADGGAAPGGVPPVPPGPAADGGAQGAPAPATDHPDYVLPESAIASGDTAEPFGPGSSRFWKVPRNLVPIYQEAARDFRIPVRYLAANGSWESGFDPTLMGDGKRSCGIHQFHHFKVVNGKRDWTLWGFSSLEECKDPKANIRMTARVWRARIDNLDPNFHCNGFLSCAIRLHMGRGANGYMRTIMSAGDRLYAATAAGAQTAAR